MQCGALGGAVSGYIAGVRGANKQKLCGAKWKVHVFGSSVIGAASGAILGKVGEELAPILGEWTKTVTTGNFQINISVTGPDIATSFAGGVGGTATETYIIQTPEAILFSGEKIFQQYTNHLEHSEMEFNASGTFK